MTRHQPALLGGLFIGVLSSLPVVNLCCCLWVIAGGVLTVYLQRQRPAEPGANATNDAVVGGLLAGLIGGLIQTVFSALLFSTGGPTAAELQDALNRFQVPPEIADRAIGMVSSGAYLVVSALVTLPVYAVFSLLGALLALALFKKTPPPAAPTTPTPL